MTLEEWERLKTEYKSLQAKQSGRQAHTHTRGGQQSQSQRHVPSGPSGASGANRGPRTGMGSQAQAKERGGAAGAASTQSRPTQHNGGRSATSGAGGGAQGGIAKGLLITLSNIGAGVTRSALKVTDALALVSLSLLFSCSPVLPSLSLSL